MSRDRRALAVGAIVVALAWVGLRGIPGAIDSVRRKEEAVAHRAELLARARQQVGGLPSLDDSIRVLDEVAAALPDMLLVGRDRETASVDLMRALREVALSRPMTLAGFAPRDGGQASGPLTLVAITATMETDFQEFLAFLAAVEADPALALESIDVRAADSHRQEGPETLTAEVGVSGWYRHESEEGVRPPNAFAR